MRTKALLAAALFAAGVATSMAQSSNVFSLNVVGYYNVTIPTSGGPNDNARFKLFCQQLKPNGINNPTLNNTLTNLPAGTLAYIWGLSGWTAPTEYLGPGDGWETDYPAPYGTGIMLKNTAGSSITVTVVGEVQQGNLTNNYASGYAPRGGMVPQTGGITAVHNFQATGNLVYQWLPGWTPPNEYLGGGEWENGEPILAVGEAIMISSPSGGNWTRNFTVQ